MQKSKLLEVLSQLDKKEQRALGKFVRSPFFNQRADVVDLYDYLMQQLPLRDEALVSKQRVWVAVFGEAPYNEKKISYTISFLYQCVKDFLAYAEFKSDSIHAQFQLVKALRKRSLDRVFEIEIRQAEKALEAGSLRNMDYHYLSFKIHQEYNHQGTRQKRLDAQHFQQQQEALNYYYIANKLKQICISVSYRNVPIVDLPDQYSEQLLRQIEQGDWQDNPSIAIYYNIYKALSSPEKHYFDRLQQLIRANVSTFSAREFKDILLLSINAAIKKINGGDRSYLLELFGLYREGLDSGALLENGQLSRFSYSNIARTGQGLKEYDWVKSFLDRFKDKVDKKYREDAYNYNLADLYSRQEKYDEVMTILQEVEFKDPLYNLYARRMLLKAYFRKNEYATLNSHLESFKNYIYRHKDLGYYRRIYLNLIRYVRKLLALDRFDRKAVEDLRQKIENEKYLVEREWLLEQL
ncbi:MAG: hypothetical protein AAFO94_06690 [Bacteroidota bacterium]